MQTGDTSTLGATAYRRTGRSEAPGEARSHARLRLFCVTTRGDPRRHPAPHSGVAHAQDEPGALGNLGPRIGNERIAFGVPGVHRRRYTTDGFIANVLARVTLGRGEILLERACSAQSSSFASIPSRDHEQGERGDQEWRDGKTA